VVRLGAFGDVVRTLPAVWALRRHLPETRLAWLVEPGAAPLLERLPWLDEVISFPRPDLERALAEWRGGRLVGRADRFRRALRGRGFDTAVDFHGILKSAVLTRWSGAGRRIGLARPDAREGAATFYNEHLRLGAAPRPRWDRNAALAGVLGACVDDEPIPGLHPEAEAEAEVETEAARRGGHALLHPGSSPSTPYKRYPVEHLARVARQLAAELGAPCAVSCGADTEERAAAAALVAAAGGAARLAETGGAVGRLIGELASARVVVSGDTGPLHLASLVGTPVVQILGPTDPIQNEPWPGTPWARAHLPLPCSPCRRGCAEAPCLALLPPADVIAATHRVLAESARGVSSRRSPAPQSDWAMAAL